MTINYEAMNDEETYVPEHMRGAFKRWIENGINPGGFGMAIIQNDLATACVKADIWNKPHIGSIVAWFWNFAPIGCWHFPENYDSWKGLNNG